MTAVPSLILFRKVVNWGLTAQAINFAQSSFMGHRVCFSVPVDLMNEYFIWKRASGEVRPTGRFVAAPTTIANLPTFATAIERCLGTQYTDLDGVAEGLNYSSTALDSVDDMKRSPTIANANWDYSPLPASVATSAPAATHYGANDLVMAFVLNKCFGASAFDAYDIVYNLDDGFGMLTSAQLAAAITASMQEEENLAAACVLPTKSLSAQRAGDKKGDVDSMFRSLLSIDPQRFYRDGKQITGLFESNTDADASGNWCLTVGDKIEVPIRLFFRAPVTVLSVVDGAKNASSDTPDEVETVFIKGEAAAFDYTDAAEVAAADRNNMMAIRLQLVCSAPCIAPPATRSTSEVAALPLGIRNQSSMIFYKGANYPTQTALGMAVAGGTAPYTYSFTVGGTLDNNAGGPAINSPPGVTLSSSGLFSFDPTGASAVTGRWRVGVTVTDSAATPASATTHIYITVNGAITSGASPPMPPSSLKVLLKASAYSGTGNWIDESTYGNNATLLKGTIAKNTEGNGIVLNGSTSWTFPDVNVGNAWTANVWYKQVGTNGGTGMILTQAIYYANSGSLVIGQANEIINNKFSFLGFYNLASNPTSSLNGITLETGVWTNIQLTWNGTNLTLYVNASQVESIQCGGISVSSGLYYVIGERQDNNTFVNGEIGEVRIYNRALSQGEVTADYNASLATFPPPSLKLLLKASSYSGTGAWDDESTYNNNATLENGTIAKNTAGNGIVLDGSTSWTFADVNVSNSWTASVWFKLDSSSDYYTAILTQSTNPPPAGGPSALLIGKVGSTEYSGGFFNSTGGANGTLFSLTPNVWTNIQVTWDGSNIKTYINSTLIGTVSSNVTSIDGNFPYRIGRAWDGIAYMTGEIGEVRIYNRPLSQGEVTADYNASLTTFFPPPSLKLLLKASSYSGTGAWSDESTYGNNATLENGTIAKNTAGNGIVLDGSTSWTFPDVAVGNYWTVSVWYKLTGAHVGDHPCILANIQNTVVGPNFNMSIGLLNLGLPYVVGFYNNAWNLGTTFDLTPGQWVNIQGTMDGSSIKTYINGVLIGTTGTYPAVDSGLGYRIGRRWDHPDYVVGEIGEVRVYNRPLSQGEVTADYNASLATFS